MEYPIANGPTLPISIVIQITSFPAVLNEDVMPVDNPTVPKAETDSNTISIKDAFSVNDSIKTANIINNIELTHIAIALSFVIEGIRLLNNITSSFIEITETMHEINNPKVVVLTPPPVPPGDAPMYISIIMVVNPRVFIVPKSDVLKPVVVEAEMA